jgi:hypothetical protein
MTWNMSMWLKILPNKTRIFYCITFDIKATKPVLFYTYLCELDSN